jgi:hypothetical protein
MTLARRGVRDADKCSAFDGDPAIPGARSGRIVKLGPTHGRILSDLGVALEFDRRGLLFEPEVGQRVSFSVTSTRNGVVTAFRALSVRVL